MNLEHQYVLCEIEKLIAGYRDEIKLLAADDRNCDIVNGKIIGALDVKETIRFTKTALSNGLVRAS